MTVVAIATPVGAATITLSQSQLLGAEEVTALFGGNGQVLSGVADGDGVLFEIEGGTIDYGKVALRVQLFGADLTAYDDFGLHIEIVTAPNPVEVNPFVLTGSAGTIFTQDLPGVKNEGDGFDSFVPLGGVAELDNVHSLGFQYFTAGDIETPDAQTVLIRVSPIPGADTAVVVPEPASFVLATLGLLALGGCARRIRKRG